MKTAVVIPAYNEEKNIGKVIAKTRPLVDWVIVVDDGSADTTFRCCSDGCQEKIFLLKHRVNLGKGAALKTGCEAAVRLGADIIVTIDADGQHPPEYIPEILNYLRQNNLDFVFSVRQGGDRMPLIRRLGNQTLNFMAQQLFCLNLRDMWCGFRAFYVTCLPKIDWRKSDYSGEIQMALKVGRSGLAYGEYVIPTVYSDATKGVHIIHGLKLLAQMIIWRIMM